MINEIMSELYIRGINLMNVIDISKLSEKENRGYSVAILIGIVLSPEYLLQQSHADRIDHSEFDEKEHCVDDIAEWLADFIITKGYKAYAQSERNLRNGFYDETTKTTTLPHKKIAILGGLGWIGKSNLLVTKEYGSALCMCTVLTNAPLLVEHKPMVMSKCGECTICKDICPTSAIHGTTWKQGMKRDSIVDVYCCAGCLRCLVHCPWTQKYMGNNLVKNEEYNQ